MKKTIVRFLLGIMVINTLGSANVVVASQNETKSISEESLDESDSNVVDGVLATTKVVIEGKIIEVPVVQNTVSTRGIEEQVYNTQTVYIPDFSKITEEENAENIAKIKSRAVDNNTFFDNGNYICFSTQLVYNKSRQLTASGAYHNFVDMISFNISREIYTNAPFAAFRNPTAMAMQIGPITGAAGELLDDIMNQKKEYGTIAFGTTYSVPSAWVSVIPNIVDYQVGVRYQVEIVPSSGSSYTIEHWHLAD